MLDDLLSNPWAYLPPRSSLWLWAGGPLMLIGLYFLTMRSSSERKKRLREVDIWRGNLGPEVPVAGDEASAHPYRPTGKGKKESEKPSTERKKVAGPPRVASLPPALHAALLKVGGGEIVAHWELVSDLAYLSLVEANGTAGSDYQTVTARLESRGPQLSVRPLPVVDGAHVANNGVQFKKDPELMENFLVEGPDPKAIGRWLSPEIRRALCALPTAWLNVEGTVMTVSVFGYLEADQLDRVVELADAIFAEHGAEGGPSLYPGDDEAEADAAPEPAPKAAPKPAAKTQVSAKSSDAPPAKKPRVSPDISKTLSETPMSKKKRT